ncbi:50S ribosomal protein L4 [Bacteroidota bacterium]
MEVKVFNKSGEDTGKKITLNKKIFGIQPNDHAIYLDVKRYLATKRQGTSKTKERSEITGSTRKIKRQKGTGTARAGSIKSPIFRGGGRTFGPQLRDYEIKLNKKVKLLARKSALTYKAKDKKIKVVEDFDFESPKTKEIVTMLSNLQISDEKALLVLSEQNKNIYLSSRNLKGSKVVIASDLSTYDILNYSTILFFESSFDVLDSIFTN